MTLDEIEVLLSGTPVQAFGPDDRPVQRKLYRGLLRALHPDTRTFTDDERADRLFHRMESLWNELTGEGPKVSTWQLSTKRHNYVVARTARANGIANEYGVTWMADDEQHGVLRLPRSPRNNDLMEREAKALKQIAADGPDETRVFFPQLVESFKHRDRAKGIDRRAVVTDVWADGFLSLAEVQRRMGDLDPKDVAWMYRRLLTALGGAHQAGVVHGAVVPERVWIHAEAHGLVLADWTLSSTGGPVPAYAKGRVSWYPPEVGRKETATAATDIHLAAKLAVWLMGRNIYGKTYDGRALRAFFNSCTLESQAARPQDAWVLLSDYDDLIARLWGKRTFRVFQVPAA